MSNTPTRPDYMTNTEAIAAVRAGKRCVTEFTTHDSEDESQCPGFNHTWRTVACDSDETDVVECYRCGRQQLARCNFDEDFA